MQDPVFKPITINKLTIKNRIFMPAMHLGMCVDFQVTDQVINFYEQRAKGGAGMISVGYATVDELSGNTQNIGAHDDKFIPGLTKLASAPTKQIDPGNRSTINCVNSSSLALPLISETCCSSSRTRCFNSS